MICKNSEHYGSKIKMNEFDSKINLRTPKWTVNTIKYYIFTDNFRILIQFDLELYIVVIVSKYNSNKLKSSFKLDKKKIKSMISYVSPYGIGEKSSLSSLKLFKIL